METGSALKSNKWGQLEPGLVEVRAGLARRAALGAQTSRSRGSSGG